MWEGEGLKVEVKDKDTEVEISEQEGDHPGLRREVAEWETSRIETEVLDDLHTQITTLCHCWKWAVRTNLTRS